MIRILVAALAVLLAVPVARAEGLAEAKASFRRGVELYKERRWKEAMEEFQAAYRAKPHGALHYNVAQCRERLDDWPGAIRSYHEYLREVPGAPDREAVAAAVRRLEEKLAVSGMQVLLLDSTPPGASTVVEGVERGPTPLDLVLRPGVYTISLTLDGHARWERQVEMPAAGTVVVEAALVAAPGVRHALSARPPAGAPPAPAPGAPPAPPPPRSRSYLPAWIAAGAAAAAGVAALAVGASARADARAIDRQATPSGAAAASHASSATSRQRTAGLLAGVAAGAAATGAALFVLEWRF